MNSCIKITFLKLINQKYSQTILTNTLNVKDKNSLISYHLLHCLPYQFKNTFDNLQIPKVDLKIRVN